MTIETAEDYVKYFSSLEERFTHAYEVAVEARSKGVDPSLEPESKVAFDLAERTEKSVGPPGIAERIRELSKIMPREEVALKIAEWIVSGKFGHEGERAAEQAIRTALSILDEGVTAAPMQGIVKVEQKRNPDGSKHLSIYFAGPIRSAGGTEMALTLVVADYVRQLLGLEKYKATMDEAKRFVEEVRIYEREVARFQYRLSDEELINAVLNLPVEVTGVETDPIEVVSYKNLGRIETNRVRGGALRVVNDGVIGRATKVLKIVGKLGMPGWDWLKKLRPESLEESGRNRNYMFMEDVIAGRPIFSLPGAYGGFRLRYGRCRNTGLASIGIHPVTMFVLGGFIATGTQIKLEKPGKAGVAVPVDSIEPPVVRLKNGDVLRVESVDEARKIVDEIESILFLGDVLVGFGEFLENNKPLEPCGYVEEWWALHLENSIKESYTTVEECALKLGVAQERLVSFIERPLKVRPTVEEAFKISKTLGIPLHPRYTYFWDQITVQDSIRLRASIRKAEHNSSYSIKLSFDPEIKEILERLCVPHKVEDSKIVIEGDEAKTLLECLNPAVEHPLSPQENGSRELIKNLSGIQIMNKEGTFIGARMGRPEKAKERVMKPLVHSLFPIGLYGGVRRNLVEAADKFKAVTLELTHRICASCGLETYLMACPKCGLRTEPSLTCPSCQKKLDRETCPACKVHAVKYRKITLNIEEALGKAAENLGLSKPPELVKGVKGLTNEDRVAEPLEKGLLRAKCGLSVFKDGTIRFDVTNAVLTHFKPIEIGLTVEKARLLGYEHDVNGLPLEKDDQLCALMTQDVIVPKKCGEYLVKVANFIDELLVRLYGLKPFYNVASKGDLVGHLVLGLSPHTSVGVVGRLIGFTDAKVCFAHPFWHAAKRRDCDGDEDSISLLMDVLLNFSHSYLPEKIGGMMDAPMLITLKVLPDEIARQAFNMEAVSKFPLEFFEAASAREDSKKIVKMIDLVYHRIGSPSQFNPIGSTHEVDDINAGNHESSYIKLSSMLDKVREQLSLAETVKAVEAREVARRVFSTHFMRDLIGNLRAYSAQKARCKKCNAKYRRIPLSGRCLKCGGEVSLTVFKGSIEKYLEVAKEIVRKYDIGTYHEQRIKLIEHEINHLFNPKVKQTALADYM
ncbi:MAG: DNA polymerase II large subunit [Candidatus Bathyarchaeia archaeon]